MSCIICVTKRPQLAAARAAWPTTEVEGHEVHNSCVYDLQLALGYIREGGFTVDAAGVVRWASNNREPFADMVALFIALGVEGIDAEATARSREVGTRRSIEAYRAFREREGYSDEELAEMRAAFGPGETVVDVLTGERTTL